MYLCKKNVFNIFDKKIDSAYIAEITSYVAPVLVFLLVFLLIISLIVNSRMYPVLS